MTQRNPNRVLDTENPVFPHPEDALDEPNGLLAMGGNLNSETLIDAYSKGIFPWFEQGQPLLWWSPDPRGIILPGDLKVSRSLTKSLRQKNWRVTTDQAYEAVVRACAASRPTASGTWITEDMIAAYTRLNKLGRSHSVEIWLDDELVGGLYGVAVGAVFCGESMFNRVDNAAKIALLKLDALLRSAGYELLDCQLLNPFLASMGAKPMPRSMFLKQLQHLKNKHCLWPKNPI